ncbi:oxygenase MpaB family protein [Pinibacter soli]|uniref:Oxygenase MpaB family protein n=1 Tax=Pinibacter soli TaxID=3044211 RepID=A0ABT6R9X0_9BACT|nr:oxygenase MpaB family protein [Pinibacter soli]MDI3319362.1 oxygenase MpaB family protein [Pinibacter soli]
MEYFVEQDHIVQKIWGKADVILLIFAGAAAEFALNKSVDWLYFTGKLPSDPLGRLFSTVGYARQIIFSPKEKAHAAIDKMRKIHTGVETARGAAIPDWAYRDVLYMLIHYSIASFEVLDRKLTDREKDDVVEVFYRMATRMGLSNIPSSYATWQTEYSQQQASNLQYSKYTADLFKQYKKHLGSFRYFILLESQKLVANEIVLENLNLGKSSVIKPMVYIYKIVRRMNAEWFIQSILLPAQYKTQIRQMNMV